ncbi:hypothetical protein AB1Y20_005848 [Prymnesium parvum]|uniref:Choline transporter-like protein n=1 Tax=Prymnesium parvum TaxID=97485 RepID=A0AB34J0L2_PRYPA
MGCCCAGSEHGAHAFVPYKSRRCTDLLCLIPFVLMVIAMFVIGVVSFVGGNPDRFIYPTDYLGQSCGKPGTNVESRPYGFYPRLDRDINEQLSTLITGRSWKFRAYTLCVAECPDSFGLTNSRKYGGLSYPGAKNDTSKQHEEFYAVFKTVKIASRCFPLRDVETGTSRTLCGQPNCTNQLFNNSMGGTIHCLPIATRPSEAVWEICPSGDEASQECRTRSSVCASRVRMTDIQRFEPADADDKTDGYEAQLAKFVREGYSVASSIYSARVYVLTFGIAMPIVLGFTWMLLLWLFAGFIVYLALFLLVLFLILSCVWLYIKAGVAEELGIDLTQIYNSTSLLETSRTSTTVYAVFAVIMTLFTLLIVILIMMWQQLISRAIAIVRETTRIFSDLPVLMVWPLDKIFYTVGLFVYGVVVILFISTIDDTSYADVASALSDGYAANLTDHLPDKNAQVVISWAVHILGVLWLMNVVLAISWTAQAGAVCQWFFATEIGQPKKSFGAGCGTCLQSTCRVLRFHLGSMAFGALILAICQIVRYLLGALDYYTQDLQKKNFVLKLVVKCVQCYMYCLEKTVQFITFYGYIFIALEGSSFCKACRDTFGLVSTYPAQVTVNNTVSALLSMIIGLSIPIVSAFLAFASMESAGEDWPIYPAITVALVAYVIANTITSTLKCAIDSIFLCSFKDMTPGPAKYMSDNLRSAFGIDSAEEELAKAGRKPLRPVGGENAELLSRP